MLPFLSSTPCGPEALDMTSTEPTSVVLTPVWSIVLGDTDHKEPWHSADDVAWSPDGERLLVCGLQVDEDVVAGPGDSWSATWLVARGGQVVWREAIGGQALAWSTDGMTFATSMPPMRRSATHPTGGEALAGGALLGWRDGVVWTRDEGEVVARTEDGARLRSWPVVGVIQAFDIGPDRAAVVGTDRGLLAYLPLTGEGWSRALRCLPVPGGKGVSVARLAPDGGLVAVLRYGGRHRDVGIHSARTGRCVKRLPEVDGWLEDAAWHPHGTLLAVSEGKGRLRVYDAARWTEVGQCTVDEGYLEAIRWQPDGRALATIHCVWGRYCRRLMLWHVGARS